MKKIPEVGSVSPFYKWKQKLLIMKLTLALGILFTLNISALTYSQKTELTLNLKNSRLEEVFDRIREQSDFSFWYKDDEVDKNKMISIQVNKEHIETVLNDLLKGQNVTYSIVDKHVVIYRPSKSLEAGSMQQQIKITGTIVDATTKEPIVGASVVVEGTTAGTVSDIEGKFSINVPSGNANLNVSFLGYNSEKVNVAGQSTLMIALVPDIKKLDEVVVVGYGTTKKSDITGSVGSLKAKDMNGGVNSSLDQMMNGKVAGVQIIQNSAEPGGGISVRVRGASSINAGTSPLYVIDGLPIDNSLPVSGSGAGFDGSRAPRNPLNALNPADIESIEVLKDASATAIYGARGANGVIMVTTKSGASGKGKVNYSTYIGVQNVAHKIDLLTPQEYKTVLNQLILDGAAASSNTITDISNDGNGIDWQDEIFHKNAIVQSHNLSFSGGKDKMNYYTSFNYFDQAGVVKSSGYKRYGAKINLNFNPSENLQFGVNLNTSYDRNDFISTGFGINAESGAIYGALNFDPTVPIRSETGRYYESSLIDMDNPLASVYGKNAISNTYRTFGTAYAKYTVLPGLVAKINVGGDIASERKDTYVDRQTRQGLAQGGIASVNQGINSNYLLEGTLSYDKQIDKHSFNAVAGVTTQKFLFSTSYAESRGFSSDASGTNNLGLGTQSTYRLGTNKAQNSLLSYLGRLNYEYNGKYLLTGAMRIDGSSRFGANNKFGYFPSVAVGWKMHQEAFLKNIQQLSVLKARASWGRTGNQEIGNYASQSTYVTGPQVNLNNALITTTVPARIANPDLKWETTEQYDFGLDFGFFQNRLSGSIDYFDKKTYDMLFYLPISPSTGFTNILKNIGSVSNKGWEFSLTSVNIDGKFKWTTNLNLSTIKNKVLSLGPLNEIISGSAGQTTDIFLLRPGLPVNTFYGYKIIGIWQTGDDFTQTTDNVKPGDLKYLNTNPDVDKTVNSSDRVDLGNSYPKLVWSVGNNFEYKNLSLNFFIEGVQGVKMLNNNLVDAYFPVSFRRNRFAEPYLNRWTNDHPSDKYPSFVNPTAQGSKMVNSYTVEDASYARLKTVTLRYTFHCNKKYLNNASVYVTGENLLTLTKYSGYDPAVNPNGGAYARVDFSAYPMARTFMAGLSVEF